MGAANHPSLCWQTTAFVLSILAVSEASRAYPHGCLYRHPSYYTYDERDDISWTLPDHDEANVELENPEITATATAATSNNDVEQFTDFRKLPSKSSKLRRPYDRYRLTRRLGAGKFSDVFEAVDIQWEDKISKAERRNKKRNKSRMQEQESGESSSGEEGGVKVRESNYCGETTDAEEDETDKTKIGGNGNGKEEVDSQSLVVLKCLKPVSERKIRRELLVLTHCVSLPSLARVIGIVLPDSMDNDGDENDNKEDNKENEKESQSIQQEAATQHHRKRRVRNQNKRLQRDIDIGSITDVASTVDIVRQKQTKTANNATHAKVGTNNSNSNQKTNNHHGTQLPALVLEHAGQKSQWFCHGNQHQQSSQSTNNNYLTEFEMKYYLCHLLIALDGLHAVGIMHRDVKPRNTLINRHLMDNDSSDDSVDNFDSLQQQQGYHKSQSPPLPPPPLMLVDLGLADFYLPGKEYNVRVASRHYKSPELLIGHSHYDYAIDLWSVGCILAGLLFRREPFFRGKDNEDQLGKIVSVLGTRDFLPYCRKCNVRLSSKSRAAIGKYCSRAAESSSSPSSSLLSEEEVPSLLNNDMGRRTPWLSFLDTSPSSTPIPSPEALDLLEKLLVYDHEQRWTAREALGHAFFDDVRERVLEEVRERIDLESRWRLTSMSDTWMQYGGSR